LGHLTRKIVSEMTYNVSSGKLNTTIPYHFYDVLSLTRGRRCSCIIRYGISYYTVSTKN